MDLYVGKSSMIGSYIVSHFAISAPFVIILHHFVFEFCRNEDIKKNFIENRV